MRPLIHPPLPQQAYGKFTTHAIVHCDVRNGLNGILDMVELIAMIRKVMSETKNIKFINQFQGEEGEEMARQHGKKLMELKYHPCKSTYIFASWRGLDVEFGLGLPLWIGFTGGKVSRWFRNFVPLIHDSSYGIETWVVLDEQEMTILESNSEFLAFASRSHGFMYSPMSLL